MKNIRSLLTLKLLTIMISHYSFAQTSAEETEEPVQWYQVEVMIFANDSAYASSSEHWPEEVELQYPARIIRLQDSGFSASLPSQPPSSQRLPSQTMPVDNGLQAMDNAIARHQAKPAIIQEQQIAQDGFEPPFVKLEPDTFLLGNASNRLGRQSNIRILFHESWRQPVISRDDSTSILIRGGERFDDHFELEGSVNLSVERYLHLKTDLWLNTFRSAAGLEFSWPKLPPIPQGLSAPAETIHQTSAQGGLPFNYHPQGFAMLPMHSRQFEVDRTVVLRQSRRMRSEELHYIDHPLMGVLVKVIPYEVAAIEPLEPEQNNPEQNNPEQNNEEGNAIKAPATPSSNTPGPE